MTSNTKTITLRLGSDYERILREEAEKHHLSLNTLANKIIGDWADYQRYLRKYAMITMPKKSFVTFLNNKDHKRVIDIANYMARDSANFIFFRWSLENEENFTKFLTLFFDRFGYGKCLIQDNENMKTFNINHDLGKNGTMFLSNFISNLSEIMLEKIPQISQTDNALVVQIKNQNNASNDTKQTESNNNKFTKKEIRGKHIVVTYENESDLKEIVYRFVRIGIKNNLLNVLFILKKEEDLYRKLFNEKKFPSKGIDSENIIVATFEEIYKDEPRGESFEPLLKLLYSVSETAKKKGKSGINLVGTLASTLIQSGETQTSLNLEGMWDKTVQHFIPPLYVLCPHKAPINSETLVKLKECHYNGIKEYTPKISV